MNNLFLRIITSILLVSIIFISFINIQLLFLLLLIVNFIVLDEFKSLFLKIFNKNNLYYFLSFFSVLIYVVFFSLILINYLNQSFLVNKFTIYFILSIIFATDIGGYIFGKIFGGKKITKISPNKTYSGAIGSIILSIILSILLFAFQKKFILVDKEFIILVILISVISQIGDMFISFLKRKAKTKDTGSILPGHGGFLDRIDGLLLALPFGILFFSV